MYLDTMQKIFSSTTKVMVDSKNSNNLLYLPLDKLIAQTAQPPASTGDAPAIRAPSSAAAPATAPDSVGFETQLQRDSRMRDGRDSRDRETR